MISRCLLLLGLTLLGQASLFAQSESIPSDIMNLYQLTLSKSPVLQRQNIQIKRAIADKQLAASQFDYQLFSDLYLNRSGLNLFNADPRKSIVSHMMTNSLESAVGVQRTLRNGMTAKAGINYTRISNNFPFNAYNENVGPFFSNNTTNTTLSLTQPLLRGRGGAIVTANEKVADIGIESQTYNASFVTAGEVFNMILGYWQYLGTQSALAIYQENQARVNKVLGITTELVKAEKKPTSDLLQIQADLKDKERQTILAEQQLYSARQNLGRVIGLSTLQGERLGQAMNAFPDISKTPTDINLEQLLDIARKHRTDLKSLQKQLEIASIYIDVAKNNLKPQLDLSAYAGYGGAIAGNGVNQVFTALGNQEGRNYQLGLGLNFLFPVNNNRAKSNLATNELLYTDQQIQIQNQIRNIELNVGIAYNNFTNSIAALKKSKESLDYYQQVFDNEQFKFQSGLTTLLNLILFQERLTFAQLDYIQSQQQFAIAISNLRYETGTLFPDDQIETPTAIDLNTFYTLPRE